jgi:zinc/manganese transport system substrate-binding protein
VDGARRALLAGLGLGALAVPVKARAAPPQLLATFSILADILRELAPPAFAVSALVGPDQDAHVFEARPADGRRLAQADLVFANGLGFEGWIDRLIRVSGYKGPVIVASQGVRPRQEGHHGTDPHAWQDLAHGRLYALNIAAALVKRWPDEAAAIGARRDAYVARIEALDAQVRGWLNAVPRAQRRIITSHEAFGYFAQAYSVDILAPVSWTTRSEPSAAAVARLIRQIREQRVKALFLENISDARLIQRIAQETGARVGGTLYSDALSASGGPADSYLKLVEHNARTVAQGLTGQQP